MNAGVPQLIYTQPQWNIPENEKTPDWWTQNVRYFSTYYNRPDTIWNQDNPAENLSFVDKGLNYALYYIGKQKNIDYNHLTSSGGNTVQNTWIKSKKGKNLVDRLCGEFIKQLSAKEISARSLSKRAQSSKMKMWEDEMIQYDRKAKEVFDELSAQFGINYIPPLYGKVNGQQDSEHWLNYSFKDDLEEAATDLGKYIEWSNDSDTTYVEAFKQDFCPSNKMAIYNYVENGKVKQKKVPFYNLISDPMSDDPFLRDQRFVGMINRYSPQQVSEKWKDVLTSTEMEEIIKMAQFGTGANEFMSTYNTGTIGWWMNRDNNLVSAVTVFWIAPRDTRYMYNSDKFGNKKLMKAGKKEENKNGDYSVNDIHYATLLGNKYLVEHGYCKNVVRAIGNKENPELPIKVMSGNTMLGDGVSIIGSVAQLIDRMDALDFKLMDMVSRHKGKSYIINGSKLDIKSKELIQDFATMNITVAPGITGEPGSPSDNQPYVYPVDMSLDSTIIEYSNLYKEMERRVGEILNLPSVLMGQQQEIIGKGVQQNTIAMASTGNANIYQNLFKFNEINLQYAINLAKIVYSEGDNDDIAPLILGDRGLKTLKIIKERRFEDVLISISPLDAITEQQKARMLAMAQSFAQNGLLQPMDYLKMEQAETMTELVNDWEYSIEKRQQEQQQMQQQQMQQQQMVSQQNNQTQIELAKMQQDAHNQRNKETNITKIGVKDMELSADKEKALQG